MGTVTAMTWTLLGPGDVSVSWEQETGLTGDPTLVDAILRFVAYGPQVTPYEPTHVTADVTVNADPVTVWATVWAALESVGAPADTTGPPFPAYPDAGDVTY